MTALSVREEIVPFLHTSTSDGLVRRRAHSAAASSSVVANGAHPWYQPTQREGFYYCPSQSCAVQVRFRTLEGYRTHIDGHLRAREAANYCRWPGCDFSTTGGLWQHEKQTHNMVESGNFLCPFDGCRRSSLDRAFHRKWDIRNHLVKAHDYSGPFRWTGPFFPRMEGKRRRSDGGIGLGGDGHERHLVPHQAVAERQPQRSSVVILEVRPCRIVITLAMVATTISLFVSLYWATARNDVSGGFTMGGYLIAVESLAIFLFYGRHHSHCHCFEPAKLLDPPGFYEQ